MNRLKVIFLLCTFSMYSLSGAQDSLQKKEIKNLLSIVVGGTSTNFGITYEHFLSRKVSLQLGIGILGGGIGMNYYPFKLDEFKKFNPFVGARSAYNIAGSGGSRVVNYMPFGINYLGLNKLYLSIDAGPAYFVQLSPNGKTVPELSLNYPNHLFSVFGALKIGFAF